MFVPVVGYEPLFMIDECGNVLSLRTGRILKSHVRKDKRVTISTKIGGRFGKSVCFKVHRLVAEAFIPNPENKPQVNHIDGDTGNNHVSNLEWVTASENIIHAYETGLKSVPCGVENPSSISNEMIELILAESGTSREVANKLGISHWTVNKYRKIKGTSTQRLAMGTVLKTVEAEMPL